MLLQASGPGLGCGWLLAAAALALGSGWLLRSWPWPRGARCLLPAAALDLGCEVASPGPSLTSDAGVSSRLPLTLDLGCLLPAATPDLGCGVSPLGCRPCSPTQGSSSWLFLRRRSLALCADLRRGVAPSTRTSSPGLSQLPAPSPPRWSVFSVSLHCSFVFHSSSAPPPALCGASIVSYLGMALTFSFLEVLYRVVEIILIKKQIWASYLGA